MSNYQPNPGQVPPPYPPPYPPPGMPPSYPPGYGAAPQTNSSAVLSLVMGIVSMLLCPITGIVGLIAGVKARREIRESNGSQAGDGLAIGGIVTSIIGLLLVGSFVVLLLAVTLLGKSSSRKFSSVSVAISLIGSFVS